MDYQIEIKQIVDYPRCRIYRSFFRDLMEDRNIRTNGSSYLFYYMVLCSFANFRSSNRRIEGIYYLISPGEWICTLSDLSEWFRVRFQHQALAILDYLQAEHYISYCKLARGNLIKFTISDWKENNTWLEYNYPCAKDIGFFFFPISIAHELISLGRCSEMDIVLDLWLHAIYNDTQIQGSDIGPVVYFRNSTKNPLISYSDLSSRWGISKASVSRLLNKLQGIGYLSLVSFSGRHGSVIYLCNYLSTMFAISDVMIDKEEVSMTFKVPIHLPDDNSILENTSIRDAQIVIDTSVNSVSDEVSSVSESHIRAVIKKVAGILATQGLSCCECPKTVYKLYSLSDCKGSELNYYLSISCPDGKTHYRFEIALHPLDVARTEPGTTTPEGRLA